MLPETFKKSMEKHYKNDKVVGKKEVNRIERKLHEHSRSVVKIFRVAEQSGQHDRALRNATVHTNGQTPSLRGAEKDHKASDKIEMRPIVNAMDGPKKTVSDIYSDVLSAVVEARNDGTLCSSTEELLEAFESFNSNTLTDKGTRIIGSMDAVSLYPNLEVEKSAEIIKEETIKSNVNFENVDIHELGIYLWKNLPEAYIRENGYVELLPMKVKNENKTTRNKETDLEDYLEDLENIFKEDFTEEEDESNDDHSVIASNNGDEVAEIMYDRFKVNTVNNVTPTMGEKTKDDAASTMGKVDGQKDDTASTMGKVDEKEKEKDDTASTMGKANEKEQNREDICENQTDGTKSSNENRKNKNKDESKKKSYWKRNERTLSKKEIRMLVAEALAILCKIIMNNHIYSFAGKTMLQAGKGCIGDRAIGVIALLVMIWWCSKFKGKLQEVKLINDLLKIYIDDVNGVYKTVRAGTQYINGKLEYNKEKEEEDENMPDDERTMKVVKDIANSIDPMIQMTIDVPSKHEDHKVPMLDVKAWLDENNGNEIFYLFYEKPTKNRYVISKDSAMPTSKENPNIRSGGFQEIAQHKA